MKHYFYKAIMLLFLAFIVSCSKDKSQKPSEIQKVINTGGNLNSTDSKVSVQFSNTKVKEAYEFYLLVKAAMVNSNSKDVRVSAKKLVVVIKELESVKELLAVAELISLTKDIKKQRDFFATLTTEFEKLINRTTIKSGEIYKQFCPMAFDGKGGYWLSDSKEVRNPYFGKEMLVCGKVKEILK